MKSRILTYCAAIVSAAGSSAAFAQKAVENYPERPITIILVSAPGASSELETRWYMEKINDSKWRFIIDYKPGAGGNVGHAYVAKAAPDGYTLLCTSAALAAAPALFKKLGYDAVKDLEPVSLVSEKPFLLTAFPGFTAKNMQEYIAYARANPGKINYGTGGIGSFAHLAGSALHNQTKTSVTFIPYKGIGDALTALIGGQLDVAFSTTQAAIPHVRSGKLRALGVTTLARVAAFSDIPTVAEQGIQGFEAKSWLGYFFPGGTPAPIVNSVSEKFSMAVKNPDVTKRILADGATPVGSTPAQFKKMYLAEIAHWQKVVTDNKISIDQ